MIYELRHIKNTEAGSCFQVPNDSRDSQNFWLPRSHIKFVKWIDKAGGICSVEVPDWLASKHRQLVGDEKFNAAKKSDGRVSNDRR